MIRMKFVAKALWIRELRGNRLFAVGLKRTTPLHLSVATALLSGWRLTPTWALVAVLHCTTLPRTSAVVDLFRLWRVVPAPQDAAEALLTTQTHSLAARGNWRPNNLPFPQAFGQSKTFSNTQQRKTFGRCSWVRSLCSMRCILLCFFLEIKPTPCWLGTDAWFLLCAYSSPFRGFYPTQKAASISPRHSRSLQKKKKKRKKKQWKKNAEAFRKKKNK